MAMAQARNGGDGKNVVPIRDLLKTKGALDRFRAYAPDVANPDRLLALASMAVSETPNLEKCDPYDVLRAFIKIAALGLEINTSAGHAYVIPFKKSRGSDEYEIQVIIGYQGYLELAYRSGRIAGFQVDVATAEEVKSGRFEYQRGTESFIRHVYGDHRDDADAQGQESAFAYAIASFTNGHKEFVVMPWRSILKVREQSSGYRYAKSQGTNSATYLKNPWVAFEREMGMKTTLRRLCKILPKSAELATAQAIDEGSEAGIPLSKLIDLDPTEWSPVELGPITGGGSTGGGAATADTKEGGDDGDDGKSEGAKTAGAKSGKAKPKNETKAKPAQSDGPPPGHPAAGDEGGNDPGMKLAADIEKAEIDAAAEASEQSAENEPGATEPDDSDDNQQQAGDGGWF